ncbi:MAG: glycosyltransferase family 4 protein [Verrucomicrobiota bacterium]
MKIALVVHDFDPRFGQGRYTVELARRLALAHDVHVYANRFNAPLEPNVTFQRVPACRSSALGTVLTFVCAAERLLAARAYDIIHAQGLSCWRADVITAHICNAARFAHAPPSNWKGHLFPLVVEPLERDFYQHPRARHLIGVSQKVAGEIAAEYDWQRPVSVIYHGTDTDTFKPPSETDRQHARDFFRLPRKAWAWLFVGEAAKGVAPAIEQLVNFPEAILLVVSRSAPHAYEALAEARGVRQRLRWVGPVENTAVAYQAADVFLYPSDYDAFGMVVAEAMAAGLPVIVGRATGAAEWIAHGRNGFLCDPRHAASLEQPLAALRNHTSLAAETGRAARATVLEHTWDRCARETLRVYEQVLHARP